MKDTAIKGTGNSRTLASVPNFLTLYPTYEAFAQALIKRELPIDIGPLNPAGVDTMGTDLNKANLLTDALCTALELPTTATPAQAMEKLQQLTAEAKNMVESKANFVAGSYIGTGTEERIILTGETPQAVLITANSGSVYRNGGNSNYTYGGLAVTGSPIIPGGDAGSASASGPVAIEIVSGGFKVVGAAKVNNNIWGFTNGENGKYNYIAFY